MTKINIQVKITYKRRHDDEPYRLELRPEEYFDPLEPGENYREDGIPKYFNTWEYLDLPLNELEWTIEEIRGTTEDRIIRTEFLKDSLNWMSHRKDQSGFEEIIHNTEIASNVSHIIRTHRDDEGFWTVNINVVHYDSGTPNEKRIDFVY